MDLEFDGEAMEWRGPAPFVFVAVPLELSLVIKKISSLVTYGWGVIPVIARIGKTEYKTSLFPRCDVYLVPVKVAVQRAENVTLADVVHVSLDIIVRQ